MGVVSAATVFVTSPATYYVVRFLLGVAEAGFFPGIILYLTYWFPDARRGRINALFLTAVAFSGVVGGPLSGWILQQFSGAAGLAGWRWLFLVEAIPSLLLGVATFFFLDDAVADAKWLGEREKRLLQAELAADERRKANVSPIALLRDARLWLFSGIYFCFVMGLYGVGFWLPNLLKSAGVQAVLDVGLLSAIPYLAAAVAMVAIGRHSDRTGERHGHLVALAGITVATVAILSTISLSWSLPTAYLTGTGTGAAAGIAFVNSVGNLAGFLSPFLVGWIKDRTHSLSGGLFLLSASFVVGAALVALAGRLVRQGRHLVPA